MAKTGSKGDKLAFSNLVPALKVNYDYSNENFKPGTSYDSDTSY